MNELILTDAQIDEAAFRRACLDRGLRPPRRPMCRRVRVDDWDELVGVIERGCAVHRSGSHSGRGGDGEEGGEGE